MQVPMFVELGKLYEKLDSRDPLKKLSEVIPWERFRPKLKRCWRKTRKSQAGRPPYDYVVMFKILILQRLNNLSDEDMEFQLLDRASWRRFLGFNPMDSTPDRNTIWNYREALLEKDLYRKLFREFEQFLTERGYAAKQGQILDATIVEVPIVRDKGGQSQDTDAKWTKVRNQSFFGYKNHIRADNKYKIIREFEITPANVHESAVFSTLSADIPRGSKVYADAAYHNDFINYLLEQRGLKNCIQEQGRTNHPLTKKQVRRNKRLSRTRKRIEHIFGFQECAMDALFIRVKTLARAAVTIAMNNLAANMRRFVFLERLRFA